MADDDRREDDGSDEDAPKKKGGMLSTIIVGLVCGMVGFAVPMVMPAGDDTEKPDTEKQSTMDIPDPEGVPDFVSFGEAVVNLDEGRLNRYLRVNVSLQIDKAQKLKIEELLKTKKAILRSWLLSYISDQSMEDIRGAAGQNRLRRAIRDQFNNTLFEDGFDRIEDVLFEDFNIQ